MRVELVDLDNHSYRAWVSMQELPFPGDEMEMGKGGPTVRVIRRVYLFDDSGVCESARLLYRQAAACE